jgi:hypothetical protein
MFGQVFGGRSQIEIAFLERGGYRIMRELQQQTAFLFGVFGHTANS